MTVPVHADYSFAVSGPCITNADRLQYGFIKSEKKETEIIPQKIDVLQGKKVDRKIERLSEFFLKTGEIAVVFQGGYDSLFLLASAVRYSPSRVTAVTVVAPGIEPISPKQAGGWVRKLGAVHLIITPKCMPEKTMNNSPKRYRHCGINIMNRIVFFAEKCGIVHIADSFNMDDLENSKLWIGVMKKTGIHSPLLDCGFSMADIRNICAGWRLLS